MTAGTPTNLRFPFNQKAATEAAAYLIRAYRKPIRIWRLLKVLHLAERESLRRHGMPIFGGTYCSMQHGPVPSEIYNLTKDEMPGPYWNAHIKTQKHAADQIEVFVVDDAPPEELTQGNVEALDFVIREYLSMDTDRLSREVHRLPEYRETKSSIRIEPVDLLRALGKTEEEICRIARALEEERAFFANTRHLRSR